MLINPPIKQEIQPIPIIAKHHSGKSNCRFVFALSEIRQQPLGVEEVSVNERFQLERNPVGNTIDIFCNQTTLSPTVGVKIYNSMGQLLTQQSAEIFSNKISLPHTLSAGLYFIQLDGGNGAQTLKFLVK